MKSLAYILVAMVFPFLNACNGGTSTPEPDPAPGDNGSTDTRISISASIDARTKAPQLGGDGSGSFAAGDIFTLHLANRVPQSTTYDYKVGETSLFWEDLPLASDDGLIDFYACYPKQMLSDGTFTFDLESAADHDLLLATTKGIRSGTEEPVELRFHHAMHRLVVNFTSDQSYVSADEIQITCTAKSSCKVNLLDGTLDNTSARTASFTEVGRTASFLIVPQSTSDVMLEIRAGEDVKELALRDVVTTGDDLESGKQLTLNLAIKDGRLQLKDAIISGWGDQGTVSDDVIM